ncbi:MAG TPA: hypothetical protein VIV14_08340 [Gammaproteobacteria bacterium]
MTRFVGRVATTAAAGIVAVFPLLATGQTPPPSALVNQRADETLDAAREASPHSPEETYAYFEEEVEAALARAAERVWDPNRPHEPSPRTPWGDPDIAGYWTSSTYTPMERPLELGGRAFYTPREAIEAFQRATISDVATDPAVVHYDWAEFGMDNWQSPIRPNLRTSLIIDPPTGRKPPLTANGRAQFEANAPRHTLESRNLYERCITGDQGPPRVPSVQAVGESQIVQTPDYVILITQTNSDVRIVHLDGEPPASDKVGSYLGYSRGHWEGDTLVIETTHFAPKARVRRIQEAGSNLHLVERLTRVEDDLLIYEATMTDPTVWEAPWTFEVPWPRMQPPGLFEWACHENNYGLINVVRGARVRAAEYAAEQSQN